MLLSHHYARDLPSGFSTPLTPTPPKHPKLLALNESLARSLSLNPDWLRTEDGIALLSHGRRPDGEAPIAMAYAGHQFGQFVPSLGDGRALLVGEITAPDGTLYDLHLKGAGRTPFSRGGDGLCALGPALREYLTSEAMAALDVPTSRALAVISTGEYVERDGQRVPGAVVARIAKSHIRIGTFQYAAAHGNLAAVRALSDVTIDRLYPTITPDNPARYQEMLTQLVKRHASLVAQWLSVGFIHGVLNTDNCTLSGETLDYGPCAFLDTYDPFKTFSFIDQQGRYAYARQPNITLWNLCRLAECLLPLINTNEDAAIHDVQGILKSFNAHFHHQWTEQFRQKLGLEKTCDDDARLFEDILSTLHKNETDFTLFFRALSSKDAVIDGNYHAVHTLLPHDTDQDHPCVTKIRHRLERETRSPEARYSAMQAANPRIIPRNHHVERVIHAAYDGDMTPFHQLHTALQNPFTTYESGFDTPPKPEERVAHTFCGT